MSPAVLQNLIYAVVQVVHNFGAAGVVGVATYGVRQRTHQARAQRPFFLIIAIAWAIQGITGLTFGITSYAFYHSLPDIHGVAKGALYVKIACVVIGFVIAILGLKKSLQTGQTSLRPIWGILLALGITALSAAAFLRWFS